MKHIPAWRQGFTLIELAIVIIIIGLLLGAMQTGRTMLRNSELNSIIMDANNYLTAVNAFRTQYRYLPGDMSNAVSYWPVANFAAIANGDGDGLVAGNERFQAWYQLYAAKMVVQAATGTAGGGGANDFIVGTNIPATKSLGGFSFYYANLTATTVLYTANLGNMLAYGLPMGSNAGPPINAALEPTDAMNIDTKTDDGLPATGKWIANGTGGGVFGNAAACTTSTSGTDLTGTYRATHSLKACSFFIMSGY